MQLHFFIFLRNADKKAAIGYVYEDSTPAEEKDNPEEDSDEESSDTDVETADLGMCSCLYLSK